jgi:hypothetical protein
MGTDDPSLRCIAAILFDSVSEEESREDEPTYP